MIFWIPHQKLLTAEKEKFSTTLANYEPWNLS